MTQRSLGVLLRKVEACELEYGQALTRWFARLQRAPLPAVQKRLLDGWPSVQYQTQLSMTKVSGETLRAVLRDANMANGQGSPDVPKALINGWRGRDWIHGAVEFWTDAGTRLLANAQQEMKRQVFFAKQYDVNPTEGLRVRWFAETPVRRMGRSGRGVIVSLRRSCELLFTDSAFQMLNGERDAVYKLLV